MTEQCKACFIYFPRPNARGPFPAFCADCRSAKNKERAQRYRLAKKEKILAYNRRYHNEYREKRNAQARSWKAKNPACAREYRAANHTKLILDARRWRRANGRAAYFARKHGVPIAEARQIMSETTT